MTIEPETVSIVPILRSGLGMVDGMPNIPPPPLPRVHLLSPLQGTM